MNKDKTDLLEILYFVKNNPGAAFFYSPNIYHREYSYLFSSPFNVLSAFSKDEFYEILELLSKEKNRAAFGYIPYEAGYLLEDKLKGLIDENPKIPFLRFYQFNHKNVRKFLPEDLSYESLRGNVFGENFSLSDFSLNTSKEQFVENIRRIKDYISEGETYQVNYTVKGTFTFQGDIISFFCLLLFNQSAKYISIINDRENFIVSFSPELFFTKNKRNLISKPMKGTEARGFDLKSDKMRLEKLSKSKKDQAENLMIVDLLRNDMGKISKFRSVKVERLFEIEKYESLFQMTSTISSRLKSNTSFSDIIKSLFPCGSITGAPKLRTMQIISELENDKRGIYTGAIGILDRDKMMFNVPIRTLVISKESGKGEVGIGSGIVWDSSPESEYNETLLKGNFLLKPDAPFCIFTTMLAENNDVFLLDRHIERLRRTADYFLFKFDKKSLYTWITGLLQTLEPSLKYKLKVSVDKWGNIFHELSAYQAAENESIDVIVSKERISSRNKFQYFKTTNRRLYDIELKKASEKKIGEVLFLNENENLTEGAVSNVFIKKGDLWLTPPVSSGILDGVYRSHLLSDKKNYRESELTMDDLLSASEVILTNALRGARKVRNIITGSSEKMPAL